ncbi:MAG: NAD(P)H-hydrate dehydratase [Candidatus Marinimicrobia bacterium]|mgnify:CR=1 FL=1|jgi:NAD(P)H-hydrate epimerase|nr:NAD(P)H-hydrate dehydratase [Candidatus Neomarinimicrobiota bacterium]MBT3495858.1 NAD(P)H-hydrate dehydratase [Candidatus Neomarinimicrobiota bacterium]MBT3692850.1 NAD(P)H-hydrate dehydratase [Candidatus Neomarinimicrobiota bacterium]MBT3731813.1 NAD(P)H-hydrate dehydratase [Candidatus Neomarinimicrobiota bacterium]MBT4144311.1 NAD(P)H-hydrate dehydratase [Candidatus Neomarinimicrobiota bacterium]
MTHLLTEEQAREFDQIAMKNFDITGISLMANAGKAIAKTAREMLANYDQPSILILTGKGNNGGDGFATALYLKKWGYELSIYSIPGENEIKGDAKHFFGRCQNQNISISFSEAFPALEKPDLIIDALLGTGISLPLREEIFPIIEWINQSGSLILSVDIPSGLDGNLGKIAPVAVLASKTITMRYPKLGMKFGLGKTLCGDIISADIGFPPLKDINLAGRQWRQFDESLAFELLKPPKMDTYKHKQGKVLVLAGSKGMTGAAILSTMSALRSGAGLTKTFVPESLNLIYEKQILEGMTIPLKDEGKGYFTLAHLEEIKSHLAWTDVLILGPGLGDKKETIALVQGLMLKCNKPMVIDADGLRIFHGKMDLFTDVKSPMIITPHLGELAKILGREKEEVEENILQSLDTLMEQFSGTAVIKTVPACTIYQNQSVLNISGNPSLATAGTGDVLTGIIGSFIAQGIEIDLAAQLAVFIHGKTADALSKTKGYRALLASDLLEEIPQTIKYYEKV